MKASSQILTAHQDSESSAPSPIHANSQSTLAAKQMLPWTLNTSASFGDASLLSAVYQRGVKWTFGRIDWQSLSWWGTQEPLKLLLPCHCLSGSKMCLLCVEDCNLQCFSAKIVGLANRFPQLLKLNAAMNALFWTLETQQMVPENGGTTLNFCELLVCHIKWYIFSCYSSLCLDLLPFIFLLYLWSQIFNLMEN